MNINKNSFHLNTMTDTIRYCRYNGWLDKNTQNMDMDDLEDILLLKKTRNQLKKRSTSFYDGYYVNGIYLKPGDIVKISVNVCEILDYSTYTKKHSIKILSHPFLRVTNVYLKLTNFKLISTTEFRNEIKYFNKKCLRAIESIDNGSGSKLNIITYNSFEPVEYDTTRSIAKQLCSEIIKNTIHTLPRSIKVDIEDYVNDYSDDFETDSDVEDNNREIILIQTHMRGYRRRCEYVHTLKAIRTIQRFIRNVVLNELDDFDERMILEAAKSELNKETDGYGCIVM